MGFFNNNVDTFALGTKITYGSLDFITNQLSELHFYNPELVQ